VIVVFSRTTFDRSTTRCTSLRRHDPDQVDGRRRLPPSQPRWGSRVLAL
jgi:hypothetical protein